MNSPPYFLFHVLNCSVLTDDVTDDLPYDDLDFCGLVILQYFSMVVNVVYINIPTTFNFYSSAALAFGRYNLIFIQNII